MKVKIKETGKLEELEIIDPKTGLDWAADMTGDDPNFGHDGDDRICGQEDFEWWRDLMTRYQKADDRLAEVRENLDDDQALYEHLESFLGVDIENHPEALHQGLDAWESRKNMSYSEYDYGLQRDNDRDRVTADDGITWEKPYSEMTLGEFDELCADISHWCDRELTDHDIKNIKEILDV